MFLCDVTGVVFWIIYALCGLSDIADGWLARKLKYVTKTGALLDSVADICFVACMETPADTRTAAMVMVVGRSNCRD